MNKRQLSMVAILISIIIGTQKAKPTSGDYIQEQPIIPTVKAEDRQPLTAVLKGREITIGENIATSTPKLSRGGNVIVKEIKIVATAYCNCKICTGSSNGKGIMASGKKTYAGAVAVPNNIPFGSIVEIDGLGTYVAEDRGNPKYINWTDNNTMRVDIWKSTHEEAIKFGVQKFTGRVLYIK